MNPIKKHYIDRNVKIIKTYNKLIDKGMNVLEAQIKAAEKCETSKSVVNRVIYDKEYPNAKEAWEIVNKEEEVAATGPVAFEGKKIA